VPGQFRAASTHVAPVGSNVGLPHGPYTDPYDDRANLLSTAGDIRTPNGEFMSVDRFRTLGMESRDGSEINDNTPRDEGGYDYFRAKR